jgi:hypothetical protein
MNREVESLEVRWALYGKRPGETGEHNALRCWHGVKGCTDCRPLAQAGVTSEVYGMSHGKAAVGQQASFRRWREAGQQYLGMTIFRIDTETISAETSGDRRGMAAARFYAFPADWVSRHVVRLAALYDAATSAELPGDGDAGPLRLDVRLGDSPVVTLLRDSAQASTWLLRLAGAVLEKPVIVTSGPPELKKRLDLLDLVLALLPAWFRAEVSATTWTDKPRKGYRLAFGHAAERGYTAISWGASSADPAATGRYAALLDRLCTDPASVEPMIRYLAALDAAKARPSRRGPSTRAADDLSVFCDLRAFDFAAPPDHARISTLLGIARSENARQLALGQTGQLPAFAIAATGMGVPAAADLLNELWSAEVAEQAGLTAAAHLADGRLPPAQLLMTAAGRRDGMDGFLRAIFETIKLPTASAKALSTLTQLLASALESASMADAVCPVLVEASDIGLPVLAVIARDRPKSLAASISALVRAAEAGQDAPLWTKAIAPWSQECLDGRRGSGRPAAGPPDEETAQGMWSQLGPGAIAAAWALAHALSSPDPVEYTWTLLAEAGADASAADFSCGEGSGWALTERFGAKLPPPARAHADLARLSCGLLPADLPQSGESEATIRQYVGACLTGCRSPRLSPGNQRRLRQLLSDRLLAMEDPAAAVTARTLLSALADSEITDDQEWLVSQLLDGEDMRPRAAEWLRSVGRKIISSRVRSPSPTTEIQAARHLRLAIRSLKETEADTPEVLDLLAQAAASEGFTHRRNVSAVGTMLRELGSWSGCRNPASVTGFLDCWKQELARRGLPIDEAESRVDDAISQIMSGIWGQEPATRLGDYQTKMMVLAINRLETRMEAFIADRTRVQADMAERQAEIQKLAAESQTIEMRIEAIRAEIAARENVKATIRRILPADNLVSAG